MRLGTRGSALALAQARTVAEALGDDVEIVTIATSGDRGARGGDKSRWVDAIEAALVAGEIDVAVHSAKDVPGDLAEGLAILAAAAPEDPRDALVGAGSLEELPAGARVGTSSLRRRAQLLAARADLDVVDLRGNVDTRLRKLDEGECDALVLAAAGLRRLGRAQRIGAALDPARFVPAPGQGVLALEGRAGDAAVAARLAAVGDGPALRALAVERRVVAALDATCHTPVGVHAQLDGDALTVRAFAGLPDGSEWVRDEVSARGRPLAEVADEVVARLRAVGAPDLLRRAQEAAGA